MMRTIVSVSLGLAFSVGAFANEVMTPEKLWEVKRVSALGLNKDKTHVIYKVTTPSVKNNSFDSKVYQVSLNGGDAQLLDQSQVISFRSLPGEDVSCLNLYRPETPRILGVPDALVQRGGFAFQNLLMDAENPWTLLTQDLEPDVIPAFGDFNSVMWILHKQV